MITNVTVNSTTTYQEGVSVGLNFLDRQLKRALKVQIKELIHWFNEASEVPFAQAAGTLADQCSCCERN